MEYRPTSSDIRIVLRIKGYKKDLESPYSPNKLNDYDGLIDPQLMIQVFDSVENALYDSDRTDVEEFFKKYAAEHNIGDIFKDAAIHRIREYRHNRLKIAEARNGSIELWAYVIAASYFVLNSTLAESFKEGYKKSRLHEDLTQFIKEQIDSKSLYIAEKIRRAFKSKQRRVEVKVIPPRIDEPKTIEVNIYGELPLKQLEKKPELTLGEVLDKRLA
jgi:hypothetical protein